MHAIGKVVVWENGGGNGRTNTAGFLNGLAGTLPPMLQVMKDIGGIDVPESLARFASMSEPADTTPTADHPAVVKE